MSRTGSSAGLLCKHLRLQNTRHTVAVLVLFCFQESELPGASEILQLLESEIAIRAPEGTIVRRTPRKIRYVLERMSLANLVSVTCSTLDGRFPKLMTNELKDLRETAQILKS